MAADDQAHFTRRAAVAAGLSGAAALSIISTGERVESPEPETAATRMPVVFLPHAGGPYSYVDFGAPPREVEALVAYWRKVRELPPRTPSSLLVISAHWEAKVPTVMTSPRPPMLYDYYGFPPDSYKISWPAPGSPQLASRVRELLGSAGVETAADRDRGFDHGTFVPLGRAFPSADVPAVQLSLKVGLDPAEHLKLGRALAPLRDEGVFIIGSGMSYHNMRGFRSPEAASHANRFNDWIRAAVQKTRKARDAELVRWEEAPDARLVHPREEHLLPLIVAAGAAGDDTGRVSWSGPVFGKVVSAVQFG